MNKFEEKKIVEILVAIGVGIGMISFVSLMLCVVSDRFLAGFFGGILIAAVTLGVAKLLSERKEWETRFLEYIESMYMNTDYKEKGDNIKHFILRNEFIVHEIERLAIKNGSYTVENPVLFRIKMIHAGCLNMNAVLKRSTDIIEIERKRYEGIQ